MSRKKKRLKRALLAGLTAYAGSKLGANKTLSGETVKTLPVTMEHKGVPEITGWNWSLLEKPTTMKGGGEIIIGKNVDKDLL
jgi:hypothetical protein